MAKNFRYSTLSPVKISIKQVEFHFSENKIAFSKNRRKITQWLNKKNETVIVMKSFKNSAKEKFKFLITKSKPIQQKTSPHSNFKKFIKQKNIEKTRKKDEERKQGFLKSQSSKD